MALGCIHWKVVRYIEQHLIFDCFHLEMEINFGLVLNQLGQFSCDLPELQREDSVLIVFRTVAIISLKGILTLPWCYKMQQIHF